MTALVSESPVAPADGAPVPIAQAAPATAERRQAGRTAVLLIDLQVDFLDAEVGRMPVPAEQAQRVVRCANRVLAGELMPDALPVMIVNQFPRSAWLGNLVRRGAAIAGTPGARLDPRIQSRPDVPVFAKQRADAFFNPDLETHLRKEGVATIWIIGVMSEACVRATAVAARRRGFEVHIALEGIATDAPWKARLASWLLRSGGRRSFLNLAPIKRTGRALARHHAKGPASTPCIESLHR